MVDHFATTDWLREGELANRARIGSGLRLVTAARTWMVLALSGAIIGLLAVIISIATGVLVDLREGHCSAGNYLNRSFCCLGEKEETCAMWSSWSRFAPLSWLIYVVFSLSFVLAACLLVLEIGPLASGSGISEIKCIASGFDLPGFLDFRTLATKAAALPLTIASGLSVGKEGPSVHYAACVGSVLAKHMLPLSPTRRRSLIVAGAAAGVAVAFGSPIGGVMFAVEEISPMHHDLSTIWQTYFCCLVATSVLSLLNPFRTGQMVLFSVQYDRKWHFFELPAFILLGVFGGVWGEFIIKWNLRIQSLRKRYWKPYAMPEIVSLVLVTAGLCYFNRFLRMDMTASMNLLFKECKADSELCDSDHRGEIMFSLAVAIILRTALLIVSYGARVPAGIFVPSLAIGALFGRFLGMVLSGIQEKWPELWLFSECSRTSGVCVDPGTFALIGAGALLSGVMHITITVVIVMFELTGALNYVIPIMIAVGVTRLISGYVGRAGIADMAIEANSLPYISLEHNFEGDATTIMTGTHPLPPGDTPRHKNYPVTDLEGFLTGSLDTQTGEIDPAPLFLERTTPLNTVRDYFVNLGPRVIYVTHVGRVVGIISQKDLLRAQARELPKSTNLEDSIAKAVARTYAKLSQVGMA